jgi:hypothetical protein
MTSGTLDLATYTITVSSSSTLNGGTVHDGELYMSSGTAKFAGTEMDCKVDVTANITQVYDTHFKDSVALDETDAGGYYMRGNIFDEYVEVTNSSTGYIRTGNAQADTFRLKAVFNLEAGGYFTIGHGATTNHFEDDVVLNNNSGATNRGFTIGGNSNAVVDFLGDVEMNVTTGSGYIKFNVGTITHHGNLTVGAQGYKSGLLTLKSYTQNSAVAVDLTDLTDNATIDLGPNLTLEGDLTCPAKATKIYSGCHFKGDVIIADLRVWNGATFDGVTDLTITTGTVTTSGNMFNDTTTITNSGTGYVNTGNLPADTFLAPVTFNLEAAGFIHLGKNNADNYFADKVTMNNHSGASNRGFQIGAHGSATNTFDGEIELNSDSGSGYFRFWIGTTHNGLLTVGSEGLNGDYLTLREYLQTGSGTIDLSAAGANVDLSVLVDSDIEADIVFAGGGTVTLTDAILRGNAALDGTGMAVTGCAFHGTTYLKKTGSTNNLNSNNKFHGVTTIENASASNYLYWGNAVADTFLTDLTLINRSSQMLWIGYSTAAQLGGDLTLDGDSAKIIRIGSGTSGRIAVFNGGSDQQITILEDDLNIQAYRIEVNKSAGRLKLNDDITLTHELKLTDGIIENQNGAVLTLNDGVSPTASNDSYVEGKVKKVGNDAFDFPVGSNGHYRPISISAPSNTTDAFTAQHINEDSDPTYEHDDKESGINEISTNEYWKLERDAGTSNVSVTLSWDDMSCGFDALANLRVVAWKDTIWKDLGNGGTTGTTSEGDVQSNGSSSVYGAAYALATIDTFACVPCRADAGEDKVSWSHTAVEIGSDSLVGITYLWNPQTNLSDHEIANPDADPHSTTVFEVSATNGSGCIAKDEVEVKIVPRPGMPPCLHVNH